MQSTDRELIRKFHAGECSQEEQKQVLQWLTSEENLMKQDAGAVADPVMEDELWNRIQPHLKERTSAKVIGMRRWRAIAVAASVLVVLTAGYFWQQSVAPVQPTVQVASAMKTYTTPMGSRSRIMLADSSIVHIMGGSSIRFPNTFSADTREFYLDSGEVFLEVASRPQQPFIVHSADAIVQVLGTAFNIHNRPRDPELKVLLTEGKIQFVGSDHTLRILTPGEELIYNKATAKINSVHTVSSPDLMTAWKDGILYFDHTPLSGVLNRLKDYYGVEIKIDPAVDLQHQLTASYQKMSLQQVLSAICFSASLKFNIDGKMVSIKKAH